MTIDKSLDILIEISDDAFDIIECLEVKKEIAKLNLDNKISANKKGFTILKTALKYKKDNILRILAVLNGKDYEEFKNESPAVFLKSIVELSKNEEMKEIIDFFSSITKLQRSTEPIQ